MSVLRNIPIARKFSIAFGLVCILCLGLGAYTYFTLRGIATQTREVKVSSLPSVIDLSNARSAMDLVRRHDLALLMCQTPACTNSHLAARQKGLSDYHAAAKAYEPLINDPRERELYPQLTSTFARYVEISDRGIALMAAGKAGDALDLVAGDSTLAIFTQALDAINADFELNVKKGETSSENSSRTSSQATWINAAVTLLIVGLCTLIGVTLTRVFAPRIGRVTEALERLASKD